MNSQQRIEAYSKAFPKFAPLYEMRADENEPGRIEGLWIMGNNYRTSGYYGAYPHGYLPRIMSMFPDKSAVAHLCSGSLPPGQYIRIDCNPALKPEICCKAEELSQHIPADFFDLVLIDPPYSQEDAEHYGTVLLSRKKVLDEIHKVLQPGGWVVWLDQVLPMFSKEKWFWGIAIGMIKSTNHRVRGVFGFQKKGCLENE